MSLGVWPINNSDSTLKLINNYTWRSGMSETWHGLPFSWSRLFTRVRWGGGRGGGGGGVGRESDLSLNAVLFVPKWSGLSSPFLTSFGKLGVDFIFIWRFHTNMTNSERSSSESDSLH